MTIPTHFFRYFVTISYLSQASLIFAQEDDSRSTLRLWVETMQKSQEQQQAWKRDQEVLTNYKEGLNIEIEELKKYIADAKNRSAAADKETQDVSTKIEAYLKAQKSLAVAVRELENRALAEAKLIPSPLLKEARTAQVLGEITKDAALTGEKETEALPKRLNNIISLLGETDKWQQTTHVKEEVHKLSDGREMNLSMLYLGLSVAYGVAPEANIAIVGTPTPNGWRFEEKPELFAEISKAISITKGDSDPTFTTLPVSKP
jgi:hypothetical protein